MLGFLIPLASTFKKLEEQAEMVMKLIVMHFTVIQNTRSLTKENVEEALLASFLMESNALAPIGLKLSIVTFANCNSLLNWGDQETSYWRQQTKVNPLQELPLQAMLL